MLALQDPHAEEFEDKEWTFVIENVSTKLCLFILLSPHTLSYCVFYCTAFLSL